MGVKLLFGQIKGYLTFSTIGLFANLVAAFLITFSSGLYSGNMAVFYTGGDTLLLKHPNWLRIGVGLLCVGFSLQLVSEIRKVRERK